MKKSGEKKRKENFMREDVTRISSQELVEVRKSEMENFVLPNFVTMVQLNGGKTIPIKSREVR